MAASSERISSCVNPKGFIWRMTMIGQTVTNVRASGARSGVPAVTDPDGTSGVHRLGRALPGGG